MENVNRGLSSFDSQPIFDREGIAHRYFEALLVTERYLATPGICAYNSKSQSRFPTLATDQQRAILESVETFNSLCASAIEKGLNLKDANHSAAWSAIRDLGLRPLSDVFSYITHEDVVEIYDSRGIQRFRSFNFLRCLSYTLDDVYCFGWSELYHRESSMNALYHTTIGQMLTATHRQTYLKPFERHTVTEISSRSRNSAEIEPRLISPLIDAQGRTSGFLHVFRILSIGMNI